MSDLLSSNPMLCEDCRHPIHDGGLTVGDCYCSVLLGGKLCGCGYQTYESQGRCTLRTKTSVDTWGCHKPAGHDGDCSTHWDCGHRYEDHSICGRTPAQHGGPCRDHAEIERLRAAVNAIKSVIESYEKDGAR